MSVAIQRTLGGAFSKESYDGEFDEATQFPGIDDEADHSGPAELCVVTCGASCAVTFCNTITCPVTGA